jgi:preprotein translocase subunit SecE
MFNTSRYKRSQGKMARQVTLGALAVIVLAGAWRLSDSALTDLYRYGVPLLVLVVGWWACFRIVNIPRFADFLISVEAEMNKVQWPARNELWRASTVVIVVIFFLAGLLFGYDFVLKIIVGRLYSFLGWLFDLFG